MDRSPVVAGRFYTSDGAELSVEVNGYLNTADVPGVQPTLLAMVPHAGYMFSGAVAGKTLGAANLASTVLLLGPNHTGKGEPLAVWPDGKWLYPGGCLGVEEMFAQALLEDIPALTADTKAHDMEHSLEVVVPFLAALNPVSTCVPIAVAEHRLDVLREVAAGMAAVIQKRGNPVSVVVSSDMSHFVSADQARELDGLALQAVLDLDPERLFREVRDRHITMCGVLPMTMGLMVAKALGASRAELVEYTNSGVVSGDYEQVVGYAGVLVS
ncbi:AmmeMemoRadiSam system protein B [Desulfovibrio ferrophilus]|uniref:MEMO1 family protein DFE_1200 n=1 Tax=Desulfovibrio ferrophilus TaxID=241368 RepID=A0A2Z6AXQ6_9BACT|nr:AmmeMemoRadiSam system protein B [Desulfovibrio ferrophilus]BBD07926.1 MEMO1 family protein DND132_0038 [Desulfovibrio ferrophilus]